MSELEKYLSEEEIKGIKNYVYRIAGVGLAPDYLEEHWLKNKRDLLEAFGGKVKYSKEVQFDVPRSELHSKIEKQLIRTDETSEVERLLKTLVEEVLYDGVWKGTWDYDSSTLTDEEFAFIIKRDFFYDRICYAINSSTLVDNKLYQPRNTPDYNSCKITIPNTNTIVKIQAEDKVFKALIRVVKAFKPYSKIVDCDALIDKLKALQVKYSQIVNTKKTGGTLTISIHPFDYMTMSDNYSNWSSCMSWKEEGQYRAGTLEMLASPCVVVAYLEGDQYDFNGGYGDPMMWADKRWRELIIVDRYFISGVKGYPYQHDELEATAMVMIKKLLEVNKGYFYKYDSPADMFETEVNGIIDVDTNRRYNLETKNMYNDCDHNSINYFLATEKEPLENFDGYDRKYIHYGIEAYCLDCGAPIDFNAEGDTLFCYNCDPEGETCCECGERIHNTEDYGYWDNNGNYYCQDCFERLFSYDDVSGDYIYSDDAVSFAIPYKRSLEHHKVDGQGRYLESWDYAKDSRWVVTKWGYDIMEFTTHRDTLEDWLDYGIVVELEYDQKLPYSGWRLDGEVEYAHYDYVLNPYAASGTSAPYYIQDGYYWFKRLVGTSELRDRYQIPPFGICPPEEKEEIAG